MKFWEFFKLWIKSSSFCYSTLQGSRLWFVRGCKIFRHNAPDTQMGESMVMSVSERELEERGNSRRRDERNGRTPREMPSVTIIGP